MGVSGDQAVVGAVVMGHAQMVGQEHQNRDMQEGKEVGGLVMQEVVAVVLVV